jgi:DNA-binding response OmpR family regulator
MATGREVVLVVTADEIFARAVEKHLGQNGYEVHFAAHIEEATFSARGHSPALVLVDRRQELARSIRTQPGFRYLPVVVVQPPGTGCSEDDCIQDLDQDVDAVICTQGYSELIARVRAILRRERLRMAPKSRYVVGRLEMDVDRHEVRVQGQAVDLTHKEFQILQQLILQPARVFSREELLNRVWGEETALEAHTLDVHIHSLRQKIERNPAEPRYILTVRGIGYKLKAD